MTRANARGNAAQKLYSQQSQRKNPVMRSLRTVVFLALCATWLSGCGNKGPLVVPDRDSKDKKDQPAATPGDTRKPADTH